jgi:DNA-binding GntR family transcriptional regulator
MRIRTAILQGELRPGQGLVERDLARLLNVSKTPIREALKVLSNSGLVTVAPFKGSAVRTVDPPLAQSIYEVRLLLEPEAVRLAAHQRNAASLKSAEEALRAAAEARADGDFASLSIWNRRFHHFICVDCGNPVLLSFLDEVQDLVALISTEGWRLEGDIGRPERWKREAEQHTKILEAVTAGDADRAGRRVRQHIDESLQRLLTVLPSPESQKAE